MDEPTTGQDEECISALGETIREFVKNGKIAIITTHDPDFTLNYADYCIVLYDGKIFAKGRSTDVLSREDVIMKCNLVKPIVMRVCEKLEIPPISERTLIHNLTLMTRGEH